MGSGLPPTIEVAADFTQWGVSNVTVQLWNGTLLVDQTNLPAVLANTLVTLGTLPELIGKNAAALLFLTSRRIKGEEAHRIGIADVLAPHDGVRAAATALAREIATCAPLGVVATRATLRQGLAERIAAATEHELAQQSRLRNTEDFQEGIRASGERREPNFIGR